MDNIQYIDNQISFDEYNALRSGVNWVTISARQFELVRKNSVFLTVAHYDGKAVAMTRIIGDGGYNFALCDVIVSSDLQGKGIGRTLVKKALDYIDSITENGETTMIHLVAAKGKENFYKHFGFIERPNDTHGAGMFIYKNKK